MKIFIPIICYNHSLNSEYAMSIIELVLFLKNNDIPAAIYQIPFDSLISRARNAAVSKFLFDPELTHLLFIDTDIQFKPEDVLKLIIADKEVVGGAYAQKWLDTNIIKDVILNKNYEKSDFLNVATRVSIHLDNPKDTPNKLMKCSYMTTGFLLIRRIAFEKISKKYPENYYINDIDGYHTPGAIFYDYFKIGINNETKRYESEDYGFSRLFLSTSTSNEPSEIWCCTDIKLKHHGWYAYESDLFSQLKMMSESRDS